MLERSAAPDLQALLFEDCRCANTFEGQVDRSLAHGASAMRDASRNGDKLARSDKDIPVPKFDDQLSVNSDEGLVGVRMTVPAKLFGHDAHPNLMIVHFAK